MTIVKSLKVKSGYHHRIHRSKKWRKSVPFEERKSFPYKRKRVRIIVNNKYQKFIKVI